MILVSTDHCEIIFLSTKYTMYINEVVQLEYFVRDPMCDLNVPLIYLSSVH